MMRKNRHLPRSLTLTALLGLLALAHPALAGSGSCTPTDKLLLPYFELRPQQLDLTTIFVLTNLSATPAEVTIDVKNRNGNQVFRKKVAFAKFQERVFDLGGWFQSGDLKLNRFADPKRPKIAVGYVDIKASAANFCGNFYIIRDKKQEDGEMLIDLREAPCKTHALLLRKAGVFDSDGAAAIWVRRGPGPDTLQAFGYDQAGKRHTLNQVALVRTQLVTLKELGWRPELDLQWLELVNKQHASFVLARYFDEEGRLGSMLRTCCFEDGGAHQEPCRAKLALDKKTNGKDDAGEIPEGSPVEWTYTITNTGGVALVHVKLVDSPMPADLKCNGVAQLDPGKTMSCTASGKAIAGKFTNTATVTAVSVDDPKCKAEARDSSRYQGITPPPECRENPAITLDKKTNGKDNAGQVAIGSTVEWTYTVTNTGDVALADVKVTDSPMPANLKCGKVAKLDPGKTMRCTAGGKAVSGPFTNTATVTAQSAGDPACRTKVQATDSSGYQGACTEKPAKLTLDKKTNGKNNGGQIAVGSEVTWTYLVRNTGQATIENLKLVDVPPQQISCDPNVTVLKAGESMTCTAKGTAVEGNFRNTATVTGVTECEQKAVEASDKSRYKGVAERRRFMTGGAFIDNTPFGKVDVRITKLNCDGSPPSNLNVEWGGQGKQRQKFKMQKLTSVTCSDTPGVDPGQPQADFDTAVGSGTGKVKGKNATIRFKFIDAGEPGTNDEFDITIKFGNETVAVAGKVDGGNYQAHK